MDVSLLSGKVTHEKGAKYSIVDTLRVARKEPYDWMTCEDCDHKKSRSQPLIVTLQFAKLRAVSCRIPTSACFVGPHIGLNLPRHAGATVRNTLNIRIEELRPEPRPVKTSPSKTETSRVENGSGREDCAVPGI